MSKVLVTEAYLEDIADAIREKNGTVNTYTPAEMAEAISEISGGSGTDVSDTTAVASDVASGKYFYTAQGVKTEGTLVSPWTKVGETWELTLEDYTSTSAVSAGSKSYGTSIVNKDKIIWVRIRDKAGKRAGYFAGSDSFIINTNKANGSTSTYTTAGRFIHRYTSSNAWGSAVGSYGVYAYSVSNAGNLTLRKCYNATYSLKIEGTYLIDVFTLDYPASYGPVFSMPDYVEPES